MGDVPPAVASLLHLLAADVEINSGTRCYACGQNFRQSNTTLVYHTLEPISKSDAVGTALSTFSILTLPNPRRVRVTSYPSYLPRLLKLSPPVPASHKTARPSCPGLHDPNSCCQEMQRTHCFPGLVKLPSPPQHHRNGSRRISIRPHAP